MSASTVEISAKMRTLLQQEYDEYLQHQPSESELILRSKAAVETLSYLPLVSVVIPVYKPRPEYYEEALQSVQKQTYPHWELILVHDGPQDQVTENISATYVRQSKCRLVQRQAQGGISAATNDGVHTATGEYIVFLDHDDLLRPHALERMVTAMQPPVRLPDCLYSDHDKIDIHGNRLEPEFKPDWSPETLLSHCYIGHLKMIKRALFLELGGMRTHCDSVQDYDLFLRMAEQTDAVVHVPEILYHWRSIPGSTALSATEKPQSVEQGKQVVQQALERRGKRGTVHIPSFAKQNNVGVYAIDYEPQDFTEHITIVIPTKDRVDLLRTCIDSIHMHTQYPHYDILVVNNNSVEPETMQYLDQENVDHITIQTDSFNFSKLMNTAVTHAKGEYVLLLNNDTEVLHDGWLTTMMGTMKLDDNIGAVGAKLLFDDNTVQHAGVVLGPNNTTAAHANKHVSADNSGYLNSLRALRNYSVVTAACLLTPKQTYQHVGGFNEKRLPVSYNDVDYCLKLTAQGYRVVYTPNAVLRHHEAETRKHDYSTKVEYDARSYLRSVWQPLLQRDPMYNPNLSVQDGCFHLRKRPPGKNILLTSHNFELQGASLFLYELARELKRKDYYVEVTCAHSGPLQAWYDHANIPVHVQAKGAPHPLHQMNKDMFDILFCNTITTYSLFKELDTRAHPLVWCIHESEYETYAALHEDLQEDVFTNASDLLFVCEATRDVYKHLTRSHTHTIYNGVDTTAIDAYAATHTKQQVRTQLHINPETTVITCIGTLCERKGQCELLESFAGLVTHYPNMTLHFVGNFADEEYEQQLNRLITQYKLHTSVRIFAATPDVHAHYLASDIFVCNSYIESFPRVILEAMAWHLPIVATNVFGIPEQIRHEQEGLLVEPGNITQLTNALQQLVQEPHMAAKLAEAAQKRVRKHFTLPDMVRRYEQLFSTIANR